MAVAEAIGTAIGEAIGRAYKIVSDLSVESVIDLLNSDNKSGRQQEMSYVDNINQSKKAHYEAEMGRNTTPVENSCLKYENHLSINTDGVTSSDSARKAFIGNYLEFPDLDNSTAKILQTFESYKKQIRTNKLFLDGDRKITTQEELRDAKNEIDNVVGRVNDSLACIDELTCDVTVEGEMQVSTLQKSRNLSRVMRTRLIKAILADDLGGRYAHQGTNDRVEMLKAQVSAANAGGELAEEANVSISSDTPLVKEVVANAMLSNQLYIELIFEEEKRVLQEALKLQLMLEGVNV